VGVSGLRVNIKKYYNISPDRRLIYLFILCVSQNTKAIFSPVEHGMNFITKTECKTCALLSCYAE
jgi:hypothetical protein